MPTMPQQIAVMNQDLDSVFREQIKLSASLQTIRRRPGPHLNGDLSK